MNGWNGPRQTAVWSAPASRTDSPVARESFGFGNWKDGKHVVGGRNMRLEKELFGDVNDPTKQHTGINFEKYEDIPVEATGAGVPEPVTSFEGSPLDTVLLENIGYAHYTTPTPVQKYSVPIVAAGRDLMACAQVCLPVFTVFVTNRFFLWLDWFRKDRWLFISHSICLVLRWPLRSSRTISASLWQA